MPVSKDPVVQVWKYENRHRLGDKNMTERLLLMEAKHVTFITSHRVKEC